MAVVEEETTDEEAGKLLPDFNTKTPFKGSFCIHRFVIL